MIWVWRGLAAIAGLLVVLGIGIAAATGPISSAPSLETPSASGSAAPTPLTGPLPTGSAEPGVAAYVAPEDRPVAVFLGDSITRGGTVDTTWGGVTDLSWFYRLVDDTEGVVRYGGMVAENGMSSTWMAGQVYNALALSPDILIVHGGTNDVSGDVDPALVVGNLQTIKAAADAAGVPMAVCTMG